MNQVFPEQPPTAGRAYSAPTALSDILAQVFPTLHAQTLRAQKPVYGLPMEGEIEEESYGPELDLPIRMVEPCPAKPSWDEFRASRSIHSRADDFFACVDRQGQWLESTFGFETAVYFCIYRHAPSFCQDEPTDQYEWMRTEGARLGLSIIHGSTLKRMYEAGLIS